MRLPQHGHRRPLNLGHGGCEHIEMTRNEGRRGGKPHSRQMARGTHRQRRPPGRLTQSGHEPATMAAA